MVGKNNDERTWATFCHVLSFIGYVFPFGNIIAPLVLWLIKKDEYPFVDKEGKKSLNFQISITIYTIVSVFLVIFLIGIPLLIGLMIFHLVAVIIASIKINNGEDYHYPLAIQFIK